MSSQTTHSDGDRFRELILYLSLLSEGDPAFGATKLNKLLFFSDFIAYLVLGKSISGEEYQCLEYGPAPRRLLPVTREMEEQGWIAQREQFFYGRKLRRTFALREPNLDIFTPREIDLVNKVIDSLSEKNASQVSELSHLFVGWKCAEYGEAIPYEAALVGTRRPNQEEITYGLELEGMAQDCLQA